jgi:hypothetical protein
LPQTKLSLKRLAGLAIALIAVAICVQQLGPDSAPVPELEQGSGWRISQTAGESNALPQVEEPEPALNRKEPESIRQGAVIAEEATADTTSDSLAAFDYGVTGRVVRSPLDESAAQMLRYGASRAWAPAGRIRAVDADGHVVADQFGTGGSFKLYGLSPGWWVIEIETDRHGHTSTGVLLTEGAPVADLDLELTLPPQVRVRVTLKFDKARTDLELRSLYLAAHTGDSVGPETSWQSLDLISSGTARLRWRDESNGFFSAIFMMIPSDRSMNLSLFFEDRWIAGRKKAEGERLIQWEIDASECPMELGRIDVQLVDALTRKPLDYIVETPQWAAKRGQSEGVGQTTFLDVPPGWRTLRIDGIYHETRQHRIYVGPGEAVEETIQLHQGVRIAGSVMSSEGDPMQTHMGAWLIDPDSGELASSPVIRLTSHHGEFAFTTMSPGTYMIRDLRPGEYGIRAGGNFPSFGTGLIRVEAPVDREGLLVELLPLAYFVLELAQEPVGPLRWKLVDEAGVAVRQGLFRSTAPQRVTLPAGTYQLETESAGGVRDLRALKLESGEMRVVI